MITNEPKMRTEVLRLARQSSFNSIHSQIGSLIWPRGLHVRLESFKKAIQ